MTPEEKQQFNELKEKVNEMQNNINLDHVYQLIDVLIPSRPEVTDADVDLIVSVDGGAGNVTVLDFPDRWLNLAIEGEIYRVGAWLKKNDSSR